MRQTFRNIGTYQGVEDKQNLIYSAAQRTRDEFRKAEDEMHMEFLRANNPHPDVFEIVTWGSRSLAIFSVSLTIKTDKEEYLTFNYEPTGAKDELPQIPICVQKLIFKLSPMLEDYRKLAKLLYERLNGAFCETKRRKVE